MTAERFRSYEDSEGKKAKVRIKKGEELGEGAMARVHAVDATVRNKKGQEKTIETLVAKKYKTIGESEILSPGDKGPREFSEAALKNYAFLKKHGFPVLPTYRLNKQTGTLLMTNLSALHPGYGSVTDNVRNYHVEPDSISEIKNFQALIAEVTMCAEKAANLGLRIESPSYNFAVPNSGTGEAFVYLTDLEDMSIEGNLRPDFREIVLAQNIADAKVALQELVGNYMHPSVREEYFSKLDEAL